MTQVAVFMGSKSDESVIRPCVEILDKLGVSYVFTITSAHRTPDRTRRLVRELEEAGVQVFICAATGRPSGRGRGRHDHPPGAGHPHHRILSFRVGCPPGHHPNASGISRGDCGSGQGRSAQCRMAGRPDFGLAGPGSGPTHRSRTRGHARPSGNRCSQLPRLLKTPSDVVASKFKPSRI